MQPERITLQATLIVIGTGVLWGFYWVPVRAMTDMGLAGPWGTGAITLAAALLLAPFAFKSGVAFKEANLASVGFIALGGAAFALYSIGFVYGRVALIILLFFLTPVWSTVIARYVMGWQTPRLRYYAIAVGLAGLTIMLSAQGNLPIPRNIGEWMALVSGLLWAIATTGIRSTAELPAPQAAFVFAMGAALMTLMLAPVLSPWQVLDGSVAATAGLALIAGGLWWGLSMAGLMWATARLEPARVGILLMAEVLVGAASAALLASEHLSLVEIIGGTLVLCAGVLEVWPVKRPERS